MADDPRLAPLVAWLMDRLRGDGAVGLDDDRMAHERVAEQAVAALAQIDAGEAEGIVDVPFAAAGPRGPIHLRVALTAEFMARFTAG